MHSGCWLPDSLCLGAECTEKHPKRQKHHVWLTNHQWQREADGPIENHRLPLSSMHKRLISSALTKHNGESWHQVEYAFAPRLQFLKESEKDNSLQCARNGDNVNSTDRQTERKKERKLPLGTLRKINNLPTYIVINDALFLGSLQRQLGSRSMVLEV